MWQIPFFPRSSKWKILQKVCSTYIYKYLLHQSKVTVTVKASQTDPDVSALHF